MPPTPGGQKSALFVRVVDVHKTSQIPSKMAAWRGLGGGKAKTPPPRGNQDFFCVFFAFFQFKNSLTHVPKTSQIPSKNEAEAQKLLVS